MKPPTLSQLADIGAKAAHKQLGSPNYTIITVGRTGESAAYAEDQPAREAFDAWVKDATCLEGENRLFEAWKAGRAMLRQCLQEEYKMPPSYGGVALLASATTKPAPETFYANGQTWHKHTPGDPPPVPRDALVHAFDGDDIGPYEAHTFNWNANRKAQLGRNIIGWRHA